MLKRIRRILLLLLILIAVVAGWQFSFDNSQPVQLLLFGWQLPHIPLGFWLLVALLLGCLLGSALGYLPNALKRRSLVKKDNKIQRLEEQLKKAHKELKAK